MPIALHENQEMAAHWKTQIELCEKENRRFHRRGKTICEKYRDDRGSASDGTNPPDSGSKRSLNLFWSNVEILKPAIYSKAPVPICERRFLDKDTTGRMAATILERALRYEVATGGLDCAVRRARDDRLLPGRGQVWIRYNPKFGMAISPEQTANDEITFDGQQNEQPQDEAAADEITQEQQRVVAESIAVDYLHWQDYYTFPPKARTENEIEGKGRRIFMSRQDLKERFEEGADIPLDHSPEDNEASGANPPKTGINNQATIYEIWWKPERKVYFVAKEYDKCLTPKGTKLEDDGVPDPLGLEGFFPCPAPLCATMTNDTLIPVPDYVEAQDQYMQIDDLTKRIDILTNACKVRGVYDAASQGVKRVFEEGQEPDLIPVDSWAMFAEKGGLKGAIDWVPIEDIASTLKILIEVRQTIMQDLDHVTGINDINRGTSDARETLGGVRLKQNSTSGRLREKQDDMARFCRDIIAIMGEIISELYDPQTLIQTSGAMFDEGLDPPAILPQIANAAPLPPPMGHNGGPPMPGQPISPPPTMPPGMPGQAPGMAPQQPPSMPSAGIPQETPEQKEQRKLGLILQAIQLLRNEKLRGFRIDIETDSTIQGDAEQEKAQRIEFVKGVTDFVQTAGQLTMAMPQFAPLAAKMLQFAVRGFRVGRDLEAAIEDFAEKAELDAKAAASQPKQPSPEQVKAQTEQMKAQAEIQRQHVENQGEAYNAQMDLEQKKIDLQMRQLEFQMKQIELEIKTREMSMQGMGHAEAGEGNPAMTVHPALALDRIAKAAEVFDIASRRNAAPKKIHRGPDGKATHITTEFKEG